MAEPVIEVKNLTKNYAGLPAMDAMNFAIRAGEVLGYLGHNGAGKSTTVKMLTGLLEPISGEILFHGRDIRDDLAGFKRRVGYVPEESYLYSFLTGWEYLDLVGTLRGVPAPLRDDKVAKMLEELSMFRHRHTAIATYSKGMRQRIMLIAALLLGRRGRVLVKSAAAQRNPHVGGWGRAGVGLPVGNRGGSGRAEPPSAARRVSRRRVALGAPDSHLLDGGGSPVLV